MTAMYSRQKAEPFPQILDILQSGEQTRMQPVSETACKPGVRRRSTDNQS
jgi:hypothetical protein